MCTGAEAAVVQGAIAAAGAGLSYMSAEEAADEQKRALLQGIEHEHQTQEKANAATQDYVKETFDPTKRQENYEAGATKNEEALGQLLAKQSELGQGGVNDATTGAVSDSYTRAKAQSTADQATKARNSARLLSRAGGSGSLFGNEAIAGADYASDMLGFGVDSRPNQNATNVRAGRNLALLGGLLSGAGRAYAGRTPEAPPNALGYGLDGTSGYIIPRG